MTISVLFLGYNTAPILPKGTAQPIFELSTFRTFDTPEMAAIPFFLPKRTMWHKILDSRKTLCYEDSPRLHLFHDNGTKHASQGAIAVGVSNGDVYPDPRRGGLCGQRETIEPG